MATTRIRQQVKNKSMCVDIPGGNRLPDVPAIVYPCHNGSNQKFRYNKTKKQFRNVMTNKCLAQHGNRVVQRCCNGKKRQQWTKYTRGRIVNVANRKCMDVEHGDYKRGNLITYKCHSGPNQKFRI